MIEDLGIIFQAFLIIGGLQVLVWPLMIGSFKRLVDGGWIIGKLGAGLIVAILIWWGGHLGLPINTNRGVAAVTVLVLIVSGVKLRRIGRGRVKEWWIKVRKWVIAEEILFGLGFVGLSLVRGFNPAILDLEKMMDFGFIKSYLGTNVLPAGDMWFAGEGINYYSFGHFWSSVMIRFWGVEPGVGFNLMLAYICGLSLSLGFSVVINLLGKGRSGGIVLGGIAGTCLAILGGNSHVWWYFLKNGSLDNYWYPEATRFIHHTIHEFPGYSLVVSDLHAHLLDLPIVLVFMLVLIVWLRGFEKKFSILLGGLLGIMMMTNTWDGLVYGLLLIIVSLVRKKGRVMKLVKPGLIVGMAVVIVSGWWWLEFKSISEGIGLVEERSLWWQLGVLWGGQVMILVGVIAVMMFKKRGLDKVLIGGLVITVVTLLVIPEFVFIRDIYSTYPRANTMFKLTYQGFIMMGLLGGWLAGRVVNFSDWRKRLVIGPLFLLIGGLMIYPGTAFSTYYQEFTSYRGLDGLAWFREELPEQAVIVDYLERNRDGKNMVEAVGDSYTKFNAISAFSGVPTIIGWKVHEWLWRGGYERVSERAEEVRLIYESGKKEEVRELLDKYEVGWIVVGKNEREKYRVREGSLRQLGEIVAGNEKGYLIKVKN